MFHVGNLQAFRSTSFWIFIGMYSIYDIENAEEKNKEEKVALCVYEIMQYMITPSCFLHEG